MSRGNRLRDWLSTTHSAGGQAWKEIEYSDLFAAELHMVLSHVAAQYQPS